MTTTRRQEASGNSVPAFLGGIAGFDGYDIATSAIATYGVGEDLFPGGCIMALSEDEEDAFYIFGTATITATACSIEVASTADCAMHAHGTPRSEEHTSELQSLMRISYAVFCLQNT